MTLIDELEVTWKETPMAKLLSQHLPGGTEENHESQSGNPVCGPRIEPRTSQRRSINHYTATFRRSYHVDQCKVWCCVVLCCVVLCCVLVDDKCTPEASSC
jgi:hypothetical protein